MQNSLLCVESKAHCIAPQFWAEYSFSHEYALVDGVYRNKKPVVISATITVSFRESYSHIAPAELGSQLSGFRPLTGSFATQVASPIPPAPVNCSHQVFPRSVPD